MRALCRLNRRFLAVMDSDRAGAAHPLPEGTLRRQEECVAQGGACVILRKREIENYLHPAALARAGFPPLVFDDFTDMKALFNHRRIAAVIEEMTADEMLARDHYVDERGEERHELLEILQSILALPGKAPRATRPRARRRAAPAHAAVAAKP
ncbi:MAG: hypothetical protein IVW57_15965 [Ktedonobacterales bacterium]|nr:hypothetical protein [Ktedonobacterales bacterium]